MILFCFCGGININVLIFMSHEKNATFGGGGFGKIHHPAYDALNMTGRNKTPNYKEWSDMS
jgi:hypothetical protein